jgi:hypothetical protein
VAVYGVDDSWWDWHDEWDSATTDWLDSEWFKFFVTEASTHPACPSPSATDISEGYICAGILTAKTLATGDKLDLDLNYYIDPDLSYDYLVHKIQFTITYDAASFELNADELTSNLFSDIPKFYGATATFDNSTPGTLTISLTTAHEDLHTSGRLMSIPIHVIADLPAQKFDFTVGGLTIDQEPKTIAPTLKGISGYVTVETAIALSK